MGCLCAAASMEVVRSGATSITTLLKSAGALCLLSAAEAADAAAASPAAAAAACARASNGITSLKSAGPRRCSSAVISSDTHRSSEPTHRADRSERTSHFAFVGRDTVEHAVALGAQLCHAPLLLLGGDQARTQVHEFARRGWRQQHAGQSALETGH